jgi:hypothetical protein
MAPITVQSLIERNKSSHLRLKLLFLRLTFFFSLREIAKGWQARPLFDDLAKNVDPSAPKGVILIST